MHERQAIREAVIAQLVGVAPLFRTAARERVFSSRQAPMRLAELPAINVFTDGEEVSPDSKNTAPRELMRTMIVAIEAWLAVKPGVDVDAALDDLALEIETAMDLDPNFGGLVFDSHLERTELGFKVDGDRPMGCAHMEFAVSYTTDLRVSESPDVFDTAESRWDIGPNTQAPADERVDHVTGINQP